MVGPAKIRLRSPRRRGGGGYSLTCSFLCRLDNSNGNYGNRGRQIGLSSKRWHLGTMTWFESPLAHQRAR